MPRTETQIQRLEDEFRQLRAGHLDAVCLSVARTVLGGPVIRVFRPNTRGDLLPVLSRLPVGELASLHSEQDYRTWFERSLDKVASALEPRNRDNPRVQPGLRWGHATKLLSLTVAGIVVGSRFFSDAEVERIQPWLYCPIDSRIIQRLKDLGCVPRFARIKDIDSSEKFYWVQDLLGEAARRENVPRVLFDDNWASTPQGGSRKKTTSAGTLPSSQPE